MLDASLTSKWSRRADCPVTRCRRGARLPRQGTHRPAIAALFFVLAFGMILRWRTQMFLEYRALTRKGSVQ
jgi:hypothetical protein